MTGVADSIFSIVGVFAFVAAWATVLAVVPTSQPRGHGRVHKVVVRMDPRFTGGVHLGDR